MILTHKLTFGKALNKPFISIITVCMNNLEELKRTMSSVFLQEFENCEIIVVDGFSEDGTQDYLVELQNKKPNFHFVSETDNGIYDAMNKGIRLASGEYTVFLNSGDQFVDKQVLNKIFASTDHKKPVDLIYGDTMMEYPNRQIYIKKPKPLDEIHKGMPFVHQSVLFKTSYLKKHPFDLSLKIAADYDLVCNLFAQGLIFKKLNFTISRYQTGGLSDIKRLQTISEFKQIALKYLPNRPRTHTYYFLRTQYERIVALIKRLMPKELSLRVAHFKSKKLNSLRNS